MKNLDFVWVDNSLIGLIMFGNVAVYLMLLAPLVGMEQSLILSLFIQPFMLYPYIITALSIYVVLSAIYQKHIALNSQDKTTGGNV